MDEQESIRRADGSSGSTTSIRIIAFSITILITASIACGLTPSTTEESVSPTIEEAMRDQQPTPSPIATEEAASIPDTSPSCPADQWLIIPTDVITVNRQHIGFIRDEDYEGFKFILVPLAIKNDSPYWGWVSSRARDSFVTTEGGFVYSPEGIGLTPDFPYLAENLQGTSSWGFNGQLEIGSRFLVPPGIAYRGSHKPLNRLYGEPDTWLHLMFKVAETQNHFVITIPKIRIGCLMPEGGFEYEEAGPFVLDLDRDTREVIYPTDRPDDYELLVVPITIEGIGSIDLLDIYRDGDSLILEFEFSNASQGYEAGGELDAYVIGDDGLFRGVECCGFFEAGPGRASEFQIEFITGAHTGSYILLWIADDGSLHIYNLDGY